MKASQTLLSLKVRHEIIGAGALARRRAPKWAALPAVVALLAQTACLVAPNDTAPMPAGAPAGFAADRTPAQVPVNGSIAHAPSTRWWMTMDDPELDRLLETAEAQNLSPRVAASRVRASRARLCMAESPDAAGAQAHPNAPRMTSGLPEGTAAPADFWQQGFDATWEISLFAAQGRHGTVDGRVATAEDRNDAMVSLLAEVARDYLELRSLRHRYDLAIDSLVIEGNVLELTRSLARQGRATDQDFSRVRNRSELARAQVAPIHDRIARIEEAIAILLDQDPKALAAELDRRGPVPAVAASMGAGLSSDLVRRRPDVRRAERWAETTNARMANALAHDCPKFTLTGNYPYDSARLSGAIARASRSIPGRPRAIRDLSDFGQTASLAADETGSRQQALLAYQYTLLSALRDVEDALTAFREGQEQDRNLSRAVDSARQALEAARSRYRMGTVDYLEVLEAERRLLSSEDGLAQSRQAVALHLVALYKALGGNWEPPEAEDPHRTQAGDREARPELIPFHTNHSHQGDRT